MLAASGEADAAGVGEQVLRQFAAPPEDDVAVVVIRVPGVDAEQRRGGLFRRWRLAPAADSVRRARKLVTEACSSWERDPAVVELIVSELVANAGVHGQGRVLLRNQDTGDGVRIAGEVGNPVPPTHLEPHAARVGGYGLQAVVRLADWAWGGAGGCAGSPGPASASGSRSRAATGCRPRTWSGALPGSVGTACRSWSGWPTGAGARPGPARWCGPRCAVTPRWSCRRRRPDAA